MELGKGKGWFWFLNMSSTNWDEAIDSGVLSSDAGALLFMVSWWLGELWKCCAKTGYWFLAQSLIHGEFVKCTFKSTICSKLL